MRLNFEGSARACVSSIIENMKANGKRTITVQTLKEHLKCIELHEFALDIKEKIEIEGVLELDTVKFCAPFIMMDLEKVRKLESRYDMCIDCLCENSMEKVLQNKDISIQWQEKYQKYMISQH